MIVWLAEFLGISTLRVWIYAGLVALVTTGALIVRQHYIDIGWNKHATKIEKQNDGARDASKRIDEKTAVCESGVNGWWDVVTKSCKLDDE